ncbi:hypothetical protein DNTS_020266 [Danionella cerebrum]|uniref:C2H2-type domain-containing protein n=1 Tax=Danionella cerebrum TaxID=2873325 RepID=A0A553MKL2_9TELE|nr:hypothetical protein DNTS_020266 [Danionella translucida]
MEKSHVSLQKSFKSDHIFRMEQGVPAEPKHFRSGSQKSKIERSFTSQSHFMETEVEVKLEPDRNSPSLDSGEPHTCFCSRRDVKVEIIDLDLKTIPSGLIPPVEVEDHAVTTKNNVSPSESQNYVGKQKASRKSKASNPSTHVMRCSEEQSTPTDQTKINKEINYIIIKGNPRKAKKKTAPHRRSTKVEPFICETCGKEFQRSDLLTDHVKIHRRQKPYVCDHCKMKFAKPSYLKIHLRRHAGDRPVTCDQCDKRFFDTYDLKVHQRDHTGERPYKCPECGKDFKRIYILNKHKLTHSKERPFQCSVCGKAYRYGYSYRLHMKEHVDEGL